MRCNDGGVFFLGNANLFGNARHEELVSLFRSLVHQRKRRDAAERLEVILGEPEQRHTGVVSLHHAGQFSHIFCEINKIHDRKHVDIHRLRGKHLATEALAQVIDPLFTHGNQHDRKAKRFLATQNLVVNNIGVRLGIGNQRDVPLDVVVHVLRRFGRNKNLTDNGPKGRDRNRNGLNRLDLAVFQPVLHGRFKSVNVIERTSLRIQDCRL